MKYPQFYEMYKNAIKNTWTVEEVDFSTDVNDLRNKMTPSELSWWKKHGQEIVNTMAAANGPDVIGLLHDKTSYGAYGDHGGAQEAVQRVPMVFWSPNLAYASIAR